MKLTSTIIISSLLMLTACGVKGDLQPKGKPEPQPATNLNVRQQGDSVLLNWDKPTRNQDGSELTDLAGFRIGLYSYAPENYCPECKDQNILATVDVETPHPARVFGRTYYFRSTAIRTGRGFRYQIVPYTESGKNAPPAGVRLTVNPAPAAPVKIRAEALDRGVKLYWTLPGETQTVGEVLGVNIYRGDSGEGLAPEPINLQPVKGNNYDDFGLANDTTYQYGIRSVVKANETFIESALSEIHSATPQPGL
jgi:hypothetical protein